MDKRIVYSSGNSCIQHAIAKDKRSIKEILQDIEREKQIELDVLKLHNQSIGKYAIANKLDIKPSKVAHIIKFDKLGLSYRKINDASRSQIQDKTIGVSENRYKPAS